MKTFIILGHGEEALTQCVDQFDETITRATMQYFGFTLTEVSTARLSDDSKPKPWLSS